MGGFKRIETEIDEIIRLTYMLGDWATEQQFSRLVYNKCLENNVCNTYMNYANQKISEVLYELD